MPEIAEVARCVHFLRLHLVGKTMAKVTAPDDANIFGKVGTSGPSFEKAVKGKKVMSAGSQGKYFWITFDKPPHVVMHLGMTGWVHIKDDQTAYTNYYKRLQSSGQADVWPPKYWKFQLEAADASAAASPKSPKAKVHVAFTDPRRFGRVRLVDCDAASIRSRSPLAENGPDPVVDANDSFTESYLAERMRARHVPVKALLLDQAVVSGIGNWVADEVLYHARAHPEQYCDEFGEEEVRGIYEAVRYVCQTAVDLLGDSDEFPGHWLFNHRWGKGSNDKGAAKLPNGEKLAFLKVGGRTSCYAPERQKKTGRVVPSIKEEPLDLDDDGVRGTGSTAAKGKGKGEGKRGKGGKKTDVEKEDEDEKKPVAAKKRRADGEDSKNPVVKAAKRAKTVEVKKEAAESVAEEMNSGRRRSVRLKRQAT